MVLMPIKLMVLQTDAAKRTSACARHFASRRPDDHNGVVVDNSSAMRSGCGGAMFGARSGSSLVKATDKATLAR